MNITNLIQLLNPSNPLLEPMWSQVKEMVKKDGETCLVFGSMLSQGSNGFPVNKKESLDFFLAVALLKHPSCTYNVGHAFFCGNGCKIDYLKAVKYFEEAANMNIQNAFFNAAMCYKNLGNQEKFVEWLMKADAIRDRSAMIALAQNFTIFEIYKLRAEHGDLSGMYDLGISLLSGEFGPADLPQAFYWFNKAANANYKDAFYNVAWFYLTGNGNVSKDLNKARYWFQKGIDRGDQNCQNGLDYMNSNTL